jgi:hypothetical protein
MIFSLVFKYRCSSFWGGEGDETRSGIDLTGISHHALLGAVRAGSGGLGGRPVVGGVVLHIPPHMFLVLEGARGCEESWGNAELGTRNAEMGNGESTVQSPQSVG